MVSVEFFENNCSQCPALRLPLYASQRRELANIDTLPLLQLMLEMGVKEQVGQMLFHPPCQTRYGTSLLFSSNPIFQRIYQRDGNMPLDYLLKATLRLTGDDNVCQLGLVTRYSKEIAAMCYEMKSLLSASE